MNSPYCQPYINLVSSYQDSSGVHCTNTLVYNYFVRHLFNRALSVFKPKCPEYWEESYFMPVLFAIGYFGVINTDRYGVIPQQCTLGDLTVQYQPARAMFANALFNRTYDLRIGEQCAIIRLSHDYCGIADVVAYYANQMALASESVGINFFNSHVAYVFAARSKAAADSYKEMYYKVGKGEPYVVVDSQMLTRDGKPNWMLFNTDVKSNYIASELLQDLRVIQTMFDEDLGIPSNNNPKKERMLVDEVNSNNQATYTVMEMFLDNLKKSCKVANNLFGIDLDFEWRYKPQMGTVGGEKVGESVTDNQRSV